MLLSSKLQHLEDVKTDLKNSKRTWFQPSWPVWICKVRPSWCFFSFLFPPAHPHAPALRVSSKAFIYFSFRWGFNRTKDSICGFGCHGKLQHLACWHHLPLVKRMLCHRKVKDSPRLKLHNGPALQGSASRCVRALVSSPVPSAFTPFPAASWWLRSSQSSPFT